MSAISLYKHGLQCYDVGNVSGAVDEFYQAVLLESAGDIVPDKAGLDRLIVELKRPMMSNPSDPAAHYNLAVVYHLKGYGINAVQQYEATLEHAPGNAKAWHGLGLVRIQRKELSKAVKALEEAVRIEPSNGVYNESLARAVELKGAKKARKV